VELRSPVVIDLMGRDIHAEAVKIRAHGPVGPIELPNGVRAWSIVGYEEAKQALVDPRFSKDARLHWTDYVEGRLPAGFPLLDWALMQNLTGTYGEEHSRLRKLTLKAFTAHRVRDMRPSIEKATAELLDELDAVKPGEVVDLRPAFAHPLPTQVICDLFGVTETAGSEMLGGAEVNVNTNDLTPEQRAANFQRWLAAIHAFVETKRWEPGDDLTSALIAAQDDGGSQRLTDDEIVGTLHFMRAAGTVPQMNMLCNTVFELLRHPEQRERVRTGQVPWNAVIEEAVRLEAPVAHLPFRFAVEDVEIGGVRIAKGDPVLVNYAAIGRDPAVHGATADQFDITREHKDNLSFGYGIHRCVGVPLAQLEAEIALPALFDRFPELDLAVAPEEIESQGSFIMNGRLSLPLVLKPATGTRK
jgi:cytochrome P450